MSAKQRLTALLTVALFFSGLNVACSKKKEQPTGDEPKTSAKAVETGAKSASNNKLQPTKKPFLWRIEGQKTSYLYGTIHVPEPAVLALPKVVDQAIDSCDKLFTEIPMDPATQMSMVGKVMLPQGQSLKQILPKDLYAQLDKLFSAAGLPLAGLNKFKIWAITTQVVMLDHLMEYASKQPLDTVLFTRAQKAGKEVGGIETVDEQIQVFDGLSQEEQIEMLRQTLDMIAESKKKGEDPMKMLVDGYLEGDEQKLWDIMMESFDPEDKLTVRLIKRLFDDRNQRMVERIEKKLKGAPDKVHFFAVGAGHLLGDKSMVKMLEQKGFKLTRTTAAP